MKRTEMVLRAAKEVAIKYVETGRLPLNKFGEAFETIFAAIDDVVPGPEDDSVLTKSREELKQWVKKDAKPKE